MREGRVELTGSSGTREVPHIARALWTVKRPADRKIDGAQFFSAVKLSVRGEPEVLIQPRRLQSPKCFRCWRASSTARGVCS